MPNALQQGSAVDLCRLVQFRINAGKGGDVDNRIITHGLPYPRPHIQSVKTLGRSQKIYCVHPQQSQQIIDQPVSCSKELHNDAHHNHCGDKVRRIGDHLCRPAQAF